MIATCGQGPDEGMAEADIIARELMALGVEERRIHIEADSTSTVENFQLSRPIWDGEPCLTIATNDFHAVLVSRLYFGLATDAL
ncbi:YdcF family protein [Exiguobacterium sp. SH3S2]|nr:YdcF family protein [Exiguobacterium sp. SH3S2]